MPELVRTPRRFLHQEVDGRGGSIRRIERIDEAKDLLAARQVLRIRADGCDGGERTECAPYVSRSTPIPKSGVDNRPLRIVR